MTHTLRRSLPHVGLLIIFLGTLALAACGSNSSSGPVTLTFGWWSNGPQKDATFAAWAQSFTTTHPNIKIKTEFLPFGDYFTKLKTTAAAGTAYDLIGQCSCQIAPYYANGQLLDLSTFSDYQSTVANLDPNAIQLDAWQGKPYGLPTGSATLVLGYNSDLFKAAGVPVPDATKPLTISQLADLAKKLTVVQGGKITQAGFYSASTTDVSRGLNPFVENAGGEVLDTFVGPKKVTINTPQGIAGLTAWQQLYTNQATPGVDDDSWKDGLAGLQSGKIAMTFSGPWEFSQYDTAHYAVAPMPVADNGQHIARSTVNSLGIYANTKHKAEAWEFLKWATQTPQQVSYSKFSDVPVEKSALANFGSVITPANFYATLSVETANIRPYLVTNSTELETTLENTLKDLARGKLTPAQAAAQMEKQGNAALANT